jgi:RHS repeat-associated protein
VRNFTTTTSPPISSHNVLANWDFENGTSPWGWYTNGSGQFSTGTPTYHGSSAAIVSITSTGNNMQLYQTGLHLKGETTYRLVFNAYATAGRDMRVYVHKDTVGYDNFGLAETVDLGTGWQRWSRDFTTTNITDSTTHGEVRFWFVNNAEAGDVYHIDSVSLYAVTQDTVPPEPLTELLITPGREQFLDDEPVLFDASLSQGGTITSYKWYVDGVLVSNQATFMRYFPLLEEEASKQVAVRLEVTFDVNDYEYADDKTVSILIKRRPRSYYYLTDHLGSIRATVRGADKMLVDDFGTEWLFGASVLPQWAHASGSGFLLYDGRLTHQSSSPSVLVNASDDVLVDGNAAVYVRFSDATAYGSLIVRYANSYYYAAEIHNDSLYLIKCCANTRVVATRAFQHVIPVDEEHRLQVKAEGNTITVTLDGVYVLSWTDNGTGGDSPLANGKVGFAHAGGGPVHGVQWDDMVVTSGIPGQVITAEDYDPWGVVMDNRSYVLGNPDQRYKFTGKERDAETGYDYFGARYYDARIGRWISVDPLAEKYPASSPFAYAANNPAVCFDPNGMEVRVHGSLTLWISREKPGFMRALDIARSTSIGSKLFNQLHENSDILVALFEATPFGAAAQHWLFFDDEAQRYVLGPRTESTVFPIPKMRESWFASGRDEWYAVKGRRFFPIAFRGMYCDDKNLLFLVATIIHELQHVALELQGIEDHHDSMGHIVDKDNQSRFDLARPGSWTYDMYRQAQNAVRNYWEEKLKRESEDPYDASYGGTWVHP